MIAQLALLHPENVIDFPQKSNEWYTPARYVEAARAVMGGIDLDPASCELANRTVKATRFYTAKDNGLAQEWYGNVWLNPPYGRIHPELTGSTRSWQPLFVQKLIGEYDRSNVKQAILLLLGNSIYKHWFFSLWEYPICIHETSIAFQRPGIKESDRLGFGSIFVYLGPHEQSFIDIFSQFGTVARRVSQPRQTVQALSLWEVMP